MLKEIDVLIILTRIKSVCISLYHEMKLKSEQSVI